MLTGVILAGGASSRFGGRDKGLIEIDRLPLAARLIQQLRPQVDRLFIIANRSHTAYAGLGVPVLPDQGAAVGECQGPLAGIRTALNAVTDGWVLTVPVDATRLPHELAQRMQEAGDPAFITDMPVCTLLSVALAPQLEKAWQAGERSPAAWLTKIKAKPVNFRDWPQVFRSVNTPEELAVVERELRYQLR